MGTEPGDIVALAGQQALWTSLMLGGPLLLALLVVGVSVAVLQALTQIQEASLAFIPKVMVLGIALLLGSSAAMSVLRSFMGTLFDQMIAVGGVG
jgi:flagellar biosynthetic protein FliQ